MVCSCKCWICKVGFPICIRFCISPFLTPLHFEIPLTFQCSCLMSLNSVLWFFKVGRLWGLYWVLGTPMVLTWPALGKVKVRSSLALLCSKYHSICLLGQSSVSYGSYFYILFTIYSCYLRECSSGWQLLQWYLKQNSPLFFCVGNSFMIVFPIVHTSFCASYSN